MFALLPNTSLAISDKCLLLEAAMLSVLLAGHTPDQTKVQRSIRSSAHAMACIGRRVRMSCQDCIEGKHRDIPASNKAVHPWHPFRCLHVLIAFLPLLVQ